MAITITHPFVSPVVDEGRAEEVGPNEWNATHTVAGLGTGVETFLGTRSLSVTNPTLTIDNTPFSPTSQSVGIAMGVVATWQTGASAKDATISVQSVIEATAPATGAAGAVYGGTVNKKDGTDAYGVLGIIRNSSAVTTPTGAAVWAIIPPGTAGDKASSGSVDALRATSEIGSQNPRSGLQVTNSEAGNAFVNGAWVEGATTYGFRVGTGTSPANVIVPTYPFAFQKTDGSQPWQCDASGNHKAASYYVGTEQILTNGSNYTSLLSGAVAVFDGGNNSDPTNYYSNTTHTFRARSAGATFATITSAGVNAATAVTTPLLIGGSGTTGTQITVKTTTGNGTTDRLAVVGGNNGATAFGILQLNTVTAPSAQSGKMWVSSLDVAIGLPSAGAGITFGGVSCLKVSSNYFGFFEPGGTNVVFEAGNSGVDATVYFSQTTHKFRSQGGGTTWVTLNSSGLDNILSETILSGTAIPAGGTAGSGYKFSSTSNFGVFFGSGAPSLSAAKGSLYLRSDGSATNNRAYINTDGSTTWTALTTAA